MRTIESTVADISHALRHFRRTPLSTITIVLVLSLGIGANVVLFTLLNSLATMPAPGMARDESLVRIRGSARTQHQGGQARLMSWPEVKEYAERTELFSGVAAHADESALVSMSDASTPLTVRLIYTTSNYFSLLDVHPVAGTPPAPERSDASLTTVPTAVISHALWQKQFAGSSEAIGQTLRVNDFPVQIVGVAPPRFAGTDGGGRLTLWVPLASYPLLQKRTAAVFSSRDSLFLNVSARLRAGVTIENASPIVAGIAERADHAAPASATMPAQAETRSADVVPMLAGNSRISGAPMDLLISAGAAIGLALLVLLITCTNVSAIMVGLAVARRREIGVRLSLGAPRARLIRQLLTESVLLAVTAAAIGLLVTTLGIQFLGALFEDIQLVVDWRVTIATCSVAVVTGILFGLSPALHATRVSVSEVLKASALSVGATRSRLQRALVVVQIALTQPLLVGLAVVVTTMVTDANRTATSTVPDRIAEIEFDTWAGRMSHAERESRINSVVERVAAMPGVAVSMPMEMGNVTAPLIVHPSDRIAGISYPPSMDTRLTAAPRGYFSAFGYPIVRGRDFEAREYAHSADVAGQAPAFDAVIIGDDLARRLWATANPIGRRLQLGRGNSSNAAPMVVVGVVDEGASGPSVVDDRFRVYVPFSAMNSGVVARTTGPALPLLNAIRRVAVAEAPQLPIVRVQTMQQREVEARRNVLRTSVAVAGGGLIVLLLSAIGLYAVVSFSVGQRTREIGIRTALGARAGQVVRMFFRQGLALSALGLVIGLPLSIMATRVASSTLNWPLSTSPQLGIAIGAAVLAVASMAVWIPARRASAIDPIIALRTE